MTVSALATAAVPTTTARATAKRVAARMRKPPADISSARLSLGRIVVCIAAGVFLAATVPTIGEADPPDISAQRLLSSWRDVDPGMSMVAEMIAAAFASGFTWGGEAAGKPLYCAAPDLKGREIMTAFEAFLRDHPEMASGTYGAAMAATLSRTYRCQ
jgi:hypothetical protein